MEKLRKEKAEPQICPILSLKDPEPHKFNTCLKKRCALYVEGHKQTPHPFYVLTYEGCGLISQIFWTEKKIEKKKETP